MQQQSVRYSRRPLLFVGDNETQSSLPIWSAVGPSITNIHDRLFKRVSWHCEMGEEGYTAFDL